MSKAAKEDEVKIPNYAKFVIAGLAGCGAVVFCQPIDVIKNRMQLSGEGGKQRDHKSSFHAVKNIVQKEGFIALFDGFSANIARQIAYTMTRLGIFQIAVDKLNARGMSAFNSQISSGLFAGFVASLVATPTDVALVRMTSDRRLPPREQRGYKHVIDALIRITREEGVTALWTGVTPTVLRATVGTAAQLVSYVQAKHYILDKDYMKDGLACHFTSSLISGLVYAFITTPIDVAKTRVQTMKTINGKPEYSSMVDVWIKTVRKEGVTALWKGFGPYYFRIAPNTVLLFIFVEQLTYLYKVYILGDPAAKGGL